MAVGVVVDGLKGGSALNPAVFTILMGCIIALASSAGLQLGYDNGVTGGVLAHPDFTRRFVHKAVDDDMVSSSQWCKFADMRLQLFTSSLFLTGIIGALVGMRTCERYGRRKTMMFGGICFLIGAVLLATAFSWAQLVIGRLVLGLGVGLATMATPFYLNEMTPPQWRGASSIIFQLCIAVGILVAQVLTYYTAPFEYGWRIALGAAGAPALLLVVATIALPESPQWLLMKGRINEAAVVLRKVYGVADVTTAMGQLSSAITSRAVSPNGLRLLFTRQYLPQLAMATVIPAAQQLTGINAIMFYAPQVFLATGLSTTAALLSSVIIGMVNVVATIVAVMAVDRLGRRFLLLQGGAQMIVTQVVVSMLLKHSTKGATEAGPCSMALVSMICLYCAAFSWSWGPLGWLVPIELQPLETRAAGTAINTVINCGFTFVIGQVFLSMLCGMQWGVFLFFAGCVALSCVFVLIALPETKNLTSEEISNALRSHRMWRPLIRAAEEQPAAAAAAKVDAC